MNEKGAIMKDQEALKPFLNKPYTYIKKLPGIRALIKTNAWRILRFKITLLTSRRRNCNFTSFLRMPTQFEALCGPVVDFLLKDETRKVLKITVLGCSTGAEAYSIASILRSHHPNLAFTIHAYDIDKEYVDKARSARYTHEEVFNAEFITADFVNATFDKENDFYVIKNDITKLVHFDVADALDPELQERVGASDIVYAQHFLIHLGNMLAIKAFNNICRLLNARAALFISDPDLGLRQKLTRRNGLMPLEYKVEEIHNEVGINCKGWPYLYTGIEPFLIVKKDWQRRYSTIFLKKVVQTRSAFY
jgi:chemotaxis protein methyltransferase CheR